MATTKSCYHCKSLEWVDGEEHDPSGFCCNSRNYKYYYEEVNHLAMLEDEAYLKKGKSCCKPKK